ncbi:MAG TPA: cytochrome c oxidase subunit II transmembrane domain-containing protein [Gemmataceae bacterium]|jgi:cytochrome c oxidase subunit 2|nr:cytochrome c oxidase subunit II transmembrane domain-containing protein [Gemmataceae bacterium]
MVKFGIFILLTIAVAIFGLYALFPGALKPSPEGGRKRWAYLFGIVLLLEALAVPFAAAMGWWLPKSASTFSFGIDLLFYIILAVTGITFIGVGAIFTYVLFKYPADPGRRSWYTHGSHKLEMVWTAVPAVLLFVLAIAQIPAWLEVKNMGWLREALQAGEVKPENRFLQVEVTARQWEWRMRYPSAKHIDEWNQDGKLLLKDVRLKLPPRPDDVRVTNEIHCMKGRKVLVHLKTMDVIHSFFLPQMRLKQDALPGKTIPVWFEPTEANCYLDGNEWKDGMRLERTVTGTDGKEKEVWVADDHYIWELACAEYCGARHSLMRGKLFVHNTEEDFLAWLKKAEADNQQTSIPEPGKK